MSASGHVVSMLRETWDEHARARLRDVRDRTTFSSALEVFKGHEIMKRTPSNLTSAIYNLKFSFSSLFFGSKCK